MASCSPDKNQEAIAKPSRSAERSTPHDVERVVRGASHAKPCLRTGEAGAARGFRCSAADRGRRQALRSARADGHQRDLSGRRGVRRVVRQFVDEVSRLAEQWQLCKLENPTQALQGRSIVQSCARPRVAHILDRAGGPAQSKESERGVAPLDCTASSEHPGLAKSCHLVR